MIYFLTEFGTIRRAENYANPDLKRDGLPLRLHGFASPTQSTQPAAPNEIVLPAAAFDSLKAFAVSQETDAVLRFFVQKGRECLQVKNYVGLIETTDGTQIEVLPKTAQTPTEGCAIVLQMLRCLPNTPFRSLPTAHLKNANLPFWEVFVAAFVEEIEKIVRQGLQKNYVEEEDNAPLLRGKLLINKHIVQNFAQQERFWVCYDEFVANIAPNRLLKSCIVALQRRSRSATNQTKLRQLRFIFEEVPASENLKNDFDAIVPTDRRFDRYASAMRWAAVLLKEQAWAGQAGQSANLSLLFPMERLFEAYVARGFRLYLPNYEVVLQDNAHYLIANHAGERKFGLRPDLVLRQNNQLLVLDTKWKWIDTTKSNYGIDQADLYQLYAYGQKYEAQEVCLIYPKHAAFELPLASFQYQNSLHLRVLPFDISVPLATAVAQVASYLSSPRSIVDSQ
ncbi:MAG: restriction endonuclease [Cytophagia bacterium]|nr:MAG: restriction endonuclease [Runella sp.]TAG24062.1 MAG: restriction endonuclease [Cytophagales bacterium]TAG34848.1 MAG: restriction endonuclease [Cytophagia bacterium]TAG58980.1 MAG: restriction endonuclease [Runella slithyformis]TAG67597.1 MAG: restriction endonuclease [Runella slithyformis]